MKINIFWAGMAAFLLLAACSKDETTETLPSIYGISINQAVPFVRTESTLSFKADISGLYMSDDSAVPENLGLVWQLNSEAKDTVSRNARLSNPGKEYTVYEAGDYTVTCYLYSLDGGCYPASASTTFKVIDPATAMEGLPAQASTTLNGQTWTTRNLYGTTEGRDYEDCEVVSGLFGRYYSWEQAQTACPAGWHLPTAETFDACIPNSAGDIMADAVFMGTPMWEYWPEVTITNALRFSAIPVGYIDTAALDSASETFGKYAIWWTASEKDGLGEFRYIVERNTQVFKGFGSKTSLLLSVRCVAD